MDTHGPESNAMAEVALALAMGFFSIMVLAMVSMGAGGSTGTAQAVRLPDGVAMAAPATKSEPKSAPADGSATVSPGDLLIYHAGRFLDASLSPIDVATWAPKGERPVLAVAPDLPMTEALAARTRLSQFNPTVTVLDEAWLARLKEKSL
jgi:hypothetical protein